MVASGVAPFKHGLLDAWTRVHVDSSMADLLRRDDRVWCSALLFLTFSTPSISFVVIWSLFYSLALSRLC